MLKRRDGDLAASNYVGVITTKRGMVVEILPKIDLGGAADPDHEKTRQTFDVTKPADSVQRLMKVLRDLPEN